jgi:hypothetical protein
MISTFVRVRTALISEEELASAVFAAQDVLGSITEFTVIVDERKVPCSLAFLVEIDGDLCETVSLSTVTGIHGVKQPPRLTKRRRTSKQPSVAPTTTSWAWSTMDGSRRRSSTS